MIRGLREHFWITETYVFTIAVLTFREPYVRAGSRTGSDFSSRLFRTRLSQSHIRLSRHKRSSCA